MCFAGSVSDAFAVLPARCDLQVVTERGDGGHPDGDAGALEAVGQPQQLLEVRVLRCLLDVPQI